MHRRQFLLGLGAASLSGCSLFDTRPASLDFRLTGPTHLVVDTSRPGTRMDSSALGLSFETASLRTPGFFDPHNEALLGLLRGLGHHGVLRLGGQSCDTTRWYPSSKAPSPSAPYTVAIDDADLDRLAAFLDACGWSLVYGIDLAHGQPARAAAEAASVQQRLGNHLIGLQIGNAPNRYAARGLRPASYDRNRYVAEWRRYAAAVREAAPGIPLAGPEAVGADAGDWTDAFLAACGEMLGFVSCETSVSASHGGNAHPRHSSRARAKDSKATDPADADMNQIVKQARAHHLPCRITQASLNTPHADTLGSALWAISTFYVRMDQGWAGLCFHEALRRDEGDKPGQSAQTLAGPIYYGLRLLARTLPGRRVPVTVETASKQAPVAPPPLLRCYAILDQRQRLQLVLINADPYRSTDVRITVDRPVQGGTLLRLTGPGLDTDSAVRLASGGVNDQGLWQPRYTEAVQWADGDAWLTVSAASAALVLFE